MEELKLEWILSIFFNLVLESVEYFFNSSTFSSSYKPNWKKITIWDGSIYSLWFWSLLDVIYKKIVNQGKIIPPCLPQNQWQQQSSWKVFDDHRQKQPIDTDQQIFQPEIEEEEDD